MFECWLNSFVFSSFLVYFFKYFTVINIKHVIKMSVFFLIFWCKLEHFVRVIIIASHLNIFKRKIPKKKVPFTNLFIINILRYLFRCSIILPFLYMLNHTWFFSLSQKSTYTNTHHTLRPIRRQMHGFIYCWNDKSATFLSHFSFSFVSLRYSIGIFLFFFIRFGFKKKWRRK